MRKGSTSFHVNAVAMGDVVLHLTAINLVNGVLGSQRNSGFHKLNILELWNWELCTWEPTRTASDVKVSCSWIWLRLQHYLEAWTILFCTDVDQSNWIVIVNVISLADCLESHIVRLESNILLMTRPLFDDWQILAAATKIGSMTRSGSFWEGLNYIAE